MAYIIGGIILTTVLVFLGVGVLSVVMWGKFYGDK
jgi:hypothetical protein